jgi:hypothetical protein
MKMIKIITLICILQIFASKGLPVDNVNEKPILDLLKQKEQHCSKYKPLLQTYLDAHEKEFNAGSGKCVFSCVDDNYFVKVIEYCTKNNCDFETFIKVLGENSSTRFFNCDVKASKFKLQKAAKLIMNTNLKVLECNSGNDHCFAKLALQNKRNCAEYSPFLEPAMNQYVEKHGYKDCKFQCESEGAKERFKGIIDFSREALMKYKKQLTDTEIIEVLETRKERVKNLLDEVLHSIFKRDVGLYKCTKVEAKN